MLDAHTEAGFLVGLPFAADGVYDFATHGDKTRQVARLGAIMLQVTRFSPCCPPLLAVLPLEKCMLRYICSCSTG